MVVQSVPARKISVIHCQHYHMEFHRKQKIGAEVFTNISARIFFLVDFQLIMLTELDNTLSLCFACREMVVLAFRELVYSSTLVVQSIEMTHSVLLVRCKHYHIEVNPRQKR